MTTANRDKQPFFLAIAGNIGVGKTLVTDLLGERLGWDTYYEPVADNPYLDDFYADMKRYSFHLQVFLLSKRFALQRKILESGRSVVQDRTIYEDTEIFARILYRRGMMDERDYHNYKDLFATMVSYLRAPDLILYLRAQPETILKRIRARGRDCELQIEEDYIRELHESYELWAERIPLISPLHVVNTEELDLKNDRKAQDELVEVIRSLSHRKEMKGKA